MKNEALAHWAYAYEDLRVARHDLAMSPRNAAESAIAAAAEVLEAVGRLCPGLTRNGPVAPDPA